jgi:hypothetical protein
MEDADDIALWELEIELRQSHLGMGKEKAIDDVITRWLKAGNPEPFYRAVQAGHAPGRDVSATIAVMLFAKGDMQKDQWPFRLELKQRKGGTPTDPGTIVRDMVIYAKVKDAMDGGVKYDEAILNVAEDVAGEGRADYRKELVEAAYKRVNRIVKSGKGC